MKLKEIKPGMVIHCPKEDDARALCEHLKVKGAIDVGYMGGAWNKHKEKTCYKIERSYNNNDKLTTCYGTVEYYQSEGAEITEFSDLIEPEPDFNTPDALNGKSNAQMGAVELLNWFHQTTDETKKKIFGGHMTTSGIVDYFSPEEIVSRITAYETAKKEQKPVEVEWVDICRIIQIQNNGFKKCVYEVDLRDDADSYVQTEEALKDYIAEHDGKYIAVTEGVCRVKEDK